MCIYINLLIWFCFKGDSDLTYTWWQDDQHVYITVDIAAELENKDLDIIIETNLCHVKLKGT